MNKHKNYLKARADIDEQVDALAKDIICYYFCGDFSANEVKEIVERCIAKLEILKNQECEMTTNQKLGYYIDYGYAWGVGNKTVSAESLATVMKEANTGICNTRKDIKIYYLDDVNDYKNGIINSLDDKVLATRKWYNSGKDDYLAALDEEDDTIDFGGDGFYTNWIET